MPDEKQYSEADVHRFFAVQYHGKTWELLDKIDRTPVENECLADYAHTSLAHWRVAGTAVHYQRESGCSHACTLCWATPS